MHLETCIKKVLFHFFGRKGFSKWPIPALFRPLANRRLENVGPFQPANSPAPFSGGGKQSKDHFCLAVSTSHAKSSHCADVI